MGFEVEKKRKILRKHTFSPYENTGIRTNIKHVLSCGLKKLLTIGKILCSVRFEQHF
jgi:hypothetical protein